MVENLSAPGQVAECLINRVLLDQWGEAPQDLEEEAQLDTMTLDEYLITKPTATFKDATGVRLETANKNYQTIRPKHKLAVEGVVSSVIRKLV